VDGRTTPLVAVAPNASWPHPSEQGWFANASPDDVFDLARLRQHLPRPIQQDGVVLPSELIAIDAGEATDSRNAMHAATVLRAIREL